MKFSLVKTIRNKPYATITQCINSEYELIEFLLKNGTRISLKTAQTLMSTNTNVLYWENSYAG